MHKEVSIWDKGVFGLVFDGREAEPKAPVRYISERNKLVLILTENGFNVIEICKVENDRELLEAYLQKYKNDEDVVFVLASDKFWNKNKEVFVKDGHPCQLLSAMVFFFDVLKPGLEEAYKLFDEELSKTIFTEALNVRFKIKPPSALHPYFNSNQYFAVPEMSILDTNSVFVDCGAYVGDSVEKIINACQGFFGKIYSFEPGKRQQAAYLARRQRLLAEWALDDDQIQLVPAGVGNKQSRAKKINNPFSNHFGATHFEVADDDSNDEGAIDIVALDEILADENVMFIKSDVEGFEMDMLRGAEQIIRQKKPLMALSIYHKLTDYYEVPLYIKSLVPEYKFRVRHHSTGFPDTVLYCTV